MKTETYIRITYNGVKHACSLKDFLLNNEDLTRQERGEIIESLEKHGYIRWGGGAQGETLIEEIENPA